MLRLRSFGLAPIERPRRVDRDARTTSSISRAGLGPNGLKNLPGARFVQAVGAGLFGCLVLGWVADVVAPRGAVIVHIVEPDVEVSVGGFYRRIDGRLYKPLIWSLRVGKHELVMTRGRVVLHHEEFDVAGAKDVVLTAWDSRRNEAPSAEADRPGLVHSASSNVRDRVIASPKEFD